MLIINIIGIILLSVILIWQGIRIYKKYKQKKKIMNQIPKEVLEDFEELERRLKGGACNGNPTQILWEFTKEKLSRANGELSNKSTRPEDTGIRTTAYAALPTNENIRGDREHVRRESLQIQSHLSSPKEQQQPRENKRKSKLNWENFG